MNTIRELIILELLERAAVIKTTGTPAAYATDIGAQVFRAQVKRDSADHPCLVVWPKLEEAENKLSTSLHKMPVRIEGFAHFGTENPSVISERILGDLIKCFTSPAWDHRRAVVTTVDDEPVTTYLPAYLENIVYQGGGVESYPEEGSVSVGAAALFLVTYWTATGDPFSQ